LVGSFIHISIQETAGVAGNVNAITFTAMANGAEVGSPLTLTPTMITQARWCEPTKPE